MPNRNRQRAGRWVTGHNIPKTCPNCGDAYLGTGKQIYCSRRCKESAKLVSRSQRACLTCGVAIAARKGQRFCSDSCKHRQPQAPRDRTCPICSRGFRVGPKSVAKYCSAACRTVAASRLKLANRIGDPEAQAARINAELQRRSNARPDPESEA